MNTYLDLILSCQNPSPSKVMVNGFNSGNIILNLVPKNIEKLFFFKKETPSWLLFSSPYHFLSSTFFHLTLLKINAASHTKAQLWPWAFTFVETDLQPQIRPSHPVPCPLYPWKHVAF